MNFMYDLEMVKSKGNYVAFYSRRPVVSVEWVGENFGVTTDIAYFVARTRRFNGSTPIRYMRNGWIGPIREIRPHTKLPKASCGSWRNITAALSDWIGSKYNWRPLEGRTIHVAVVTGLTNG